MLAGGLGMIGHAYPTGPARARAAAIWGAAVGAGTGLGGIVAVVLDGAEGSWRVTYAATAVAAFVLAVVARRLLPESVTAAPRPVDLAGVLLLAAGMGALLAGLVESRSGTPWTSVALLVVGAALLGAFVAVQARRRAPLIDLALFRSRGFVAATVGALVAGIGVVGVVSYVPTVLQRGLGAALPAVMVLMLVWSVVGTATSWLLRRAHAISGGCCSWCRSGSARRGWWGSRCWRRGRRCGGCCPGSSSSAWATAARTPRWAGRRSPTCRRPGRGWAAARATPPATWARRSASRSRRCSPPRPPPRPRC